MKLTPGKTIFVAVLLVAASGLVRTESQTANQTAAEPPVAGVPGPGGPRQGPPRPSAEMLAACTDKAENAACKVKTPSGKVVGGSCHRGPMGEPAACLPSRMNGPGGIGPMSRGGGMGRAFTAGPTVAGTEAETAGVLCGLKIATTNPSVHLPSTAQWTCSGNQRTLVANGIPNHAIGAFPNPGNPNRVAVQNVNVWTTLTPALRKDGPVPVKIPGFALNGIKFDPGTAQSCTEDCGNHGRDPSGPWRIEALNQSYFQFGVDENNAHVQPGGSYHYHGVPNGLLAADGNTGQKMTLVGWAADGFPMYAKYAYSNAGDAHSPVRALAASYRVKATPDAGRPAVGVAPMGTFAQDYQYVAGSGDLDECNGRTGVTPEFPKGTYFYLITESYPYVPRCVKGNPTMVEDGPGGGPPGRGPRGGGRMGGPPPF